MSRIKHDLLSALIDAKAGDKNYRDIAKESGLGTTSIFTRVRQGHDTSVATLTKIADWLGVSLDLLVERDTDPLVKSWGWGEILEAISSDQSIDYRYTQNAIDAIYGIYRAYQQLSLDSPEGEQAERKIS